MLRSEGDMFRTSQYIKAGISNLAFSSHTKKSRLMKKLFRRPEYDFCLVVGTQLIGNSCGGVSIWELLS